MSIIQDIRDTFARRDNALNQLIVLNIIVFAVVVLLYAIAFLTQTGGWYALFMRQLELSANLGVVIRHPWTVLTYAFVHQNPFHILSNMLYLYWFGGLFREYLGDKRLLSVYVLGALAGSITVLLACNLIPVLQPIADARLPVIGASAAGMAIVVAIATKLPNYEFVLPFIGPVKIKWIATVMVLFSVAVINKGNTAGEISHIGGVLLGFIYSKQLDAGTDLGRPIIAVGEWFGRLFSGQPSMRVTHRQAATVARPASGNAKVTSSSTGQEEIDLILDKISRSGYESLSKDEKQKLFRASQQ